ncbi:MAG TPA: DinB family protein [Pyrinomonadaceae bacterium]
MKPVVHSLNCSIDFLVEQLGDVSDAELAAQPAGIVNHPLWTVGHLTFVLQMIGSVIGASQLLPEGFHSLFGPGSAPVAEAGIYGTREEAISTLREIQAVVVDAVEKLDDARLEEPFPDRAYLDVFPTVRHALTQVLVGHTAFHVGPLSIWRKAVGLPPMNRSYE